MHHHDFNRHMSRLEQYTSYRTLTSRVILGTPSNSSGITYVKFQTSKSLIVSPAPPIAPPNCKLYDSFALVDTSTSKPTTPLQSAIVRFCLKVPTTRVKIELELP